MNTCNRTSARRLSFRSAAGSAGPAAAFRSESRFARAKSFCWRSAAAGLSDTAALRRARLLARKILPQRRELLVFAGLIVLFSGPVLCGSMWQSMIFQPDAVRSGEWWRLFTHPFVHVTWYHLLLDATAFFLLYNGLLEKKIAGRLAYVAASGAGSLLLSWLCVPAIATRGLCGLSGIAHGLMAVSAIEMMTNQPRQSTEWRMGAFTFALVISKAAFEAISGHIFFGFLYFGMVGDPVAVSHAGGIVGGLSAMLFMRCIGARTATSANLGMKPRTVYS